MDLPYGSELLMLPGRTPVVYSFEKKGFQALARNPYNPGEKIYPVAAFNSPGWVNRYFAAYRDGRKSAFLPLFSYGAAGFYKNGFRSAALCVDEEPRQDLRQMPYDGVVAGIAAMREIYPDNRLIRHLEKCALEYGCPAGKNFFLKRYEAPLPTAQRCNARCLGCISLQYENGIVPPQDRIDFEPTPGEICEVAVAHIRSVDQPVASFGQGCEGDPLTASHVIEPALKRIRKKTTDGTLNMNTNAGLPHRMAALFDAGLDSVRVSMNSVRNACYDRYFRPAGYSFTDVLKSIDIALERGKFVSLNYLNCPGLTDSAHEFDALLEFLGKYPVDMIQWRNMNFDPRRYCRMMFEAGGESAPLGIDVVISRLRKIFPGLRHGYFNPPKERYGKPD